MNVKEEGKRRSLIVPSLLDKQFEKARQGRHRTRTAAFCHALELYVEEANKQ